MPLESARCGAASALAHSRGPWWRERDLRQLYIRGASPEQAVEHVQVLYWNSRSIELLRPKR
jgi:esterase/lipase superfamily enzyme